MRNSKGNRVIIDVDNDDWISEIDFTDVNVVEALAKTYGIVLAGGTVENNKAEEVLHENVI